jgi:hypothetical protein
MESVSFSEMLVFTYESAQCHNPEECQGNFMVRQIQ